MEDHTDFLTIKGASEHNLKNLDVSIPKNKLVVFTGVSGSGKSSLAFDTIFAEGQRRYIESLSSYARQFIGQMEKPRYETIRGLSPTISIEQKSASTNPRSTVGTITEIYDYLRVLYARIGVQYCQKCGKVVDKGDSQTIVEQILEMPVGTKFMVLAPLIQNRKGEYRSLFEDLKKDGFTRIRVDGVIRGVEEEIPLSKHKKHNIEVVLDRLVMKSDQGFVKRLRDSVESALKLGNGELLIHLLDKEDIRYSEKKSCCGIAYPDLEPTLFSFNSPKGMCPSCNGLGTILSMDVNKVIPNPDLSIREGAIVPWKTYFNKGESKDGTWGMEQLKALETQWEIDLDTPWKELPKSQKLIVLNGDGERELIVDWRSAKIQGQVTMKWEGIMNTLMRRYLQTTSENQKKYYAQFMSSQMCQECQGERLKVQVLHVKIKGESIVALTQMSIEEVHHFLKSMALKGNQRLIAEELLKEIISRLTFLLNVGLGYLSMDRKGPTLSGGESQRIRLASQIGSELTGVLYILDEPSIGLHQKDNFQLLNSLCHLRDIGNSLIVVEHDRDTMEEADWILDIGPGAGKLGGQIVAAGTPEALKTDKKSLTGLYLSDQRQIEIPQGRRPVKQRGGAFLSIKKASENNLRRIDVKIPLGRFVLITGVSGAGKSTLVNQILYPALANHLNKSTLRTGKHLKIEGLTAVNKVINIDQKAIGRTPRSNPATYTKLFDHIRDLFAQLPEAKARGYKKGRFSFNVKGGRCEHCKGDGAIKVEMHFLADVFVPCEVCGGKRFNESTLEIKYRDHSINDVLNLSVREASDIFKNQPKIKTILDTLMHVGLDYIKLGQSAITLSGGEAQRIKLARELAKKDTGQTLYILDEPTTGLHFEDIKKLLNVLHSLVDAGNSVVVIEHNLDVIKNADWIIDLGPDGGNNGGLVVAEGTPEKVITVENSYTGKYLKEVL